MSAASGAGGRRAVSMQHAGRPGQLKLQACVPSFPCLRKCLLRCICCPLALPYASNAACCRGPPPARAWLCGRGSSLAMSACSWPRSWRGAARTCFSRCPFLSQHPCLPTGGNYRIRPNPRTKKNQGQGRRRLTRAAEKDKGVWGAEGRSQWSGARREGEVPERRHLHPACIPLPHSPGPWRLPPPCRPAGCRRRRPRTTTSRAIPACPSPPSPVRRGLLAIQRLLPSRRRQGRSAIAMLAFGQGQRTVACRGSWPSRRSTQHSPVKTAS